MAPYGPMNIPAGEKKQLMVSLLDAIRGGQVSTTKCGQAMMDQIIGDLGTLKSSDWVISKSFWNKLDEYTRQEYTTNVLAGQKDILIPW